MSNMEQGASVIPERQEIEQQVTELNDQAAAVLAASEEFQIATDEQYQASAEQLRKIKTAQANLKAKKDRALKPLNQALREVREWFKAPEGVLQEAERVLKGRIGAFNRERERRQREEQARLEEKARKDRARKLEQARRAEEAGKAERAAALEQEAATVVAPTSQQAAPRVEGISFREVWRFRIVDAAQIPDAYKVVDEKRIGQVVRAMKGDTNIAGVEVYCEKVPTAQQG